MNDDNKDPVPVLKLEEFEEGEVGEPVKITTPAGTIRAIWLGTVSNGKELAEAMRLMWDIATERETETLVE